LNGDVDKLVAAIREYQSSAARCEAEGRSARAAFEKSFTKRRAVEQFQALLASL